MVGVLGNLLDNFKGHHLLTHIITCKVKTKLQPELEFQKLQELQASATPVTTPRKVERMEPAVFYGFFSQVPFISEILGNGTSVSGELKVSTFWAFFCSLGFIALASQRQWPPTWRHGCFHRSRLGCQTTSWAFHLLINAAQASLTWRELRGGVSRGYRYHHITSILTLTSGWFRKKASFTSFPTPVERKFFVSSVCFDSLRRIGRMWPACWSCENRGLGFE